MKTTVVQQIIFVDSLTSHPLIFLIKKNRITSHQKYVFCRDLQLLSNFLFLNISRGINKKTKINKNISWHRAANPIRVAERNVSQCERVIDSR